ncbi:hypothetical protein PspLS_10561 [Pyricularia sp. CBS 133598]|nr:hypothetical protein PspLS_10561 [Pyricularia sp. CBS 133598]
MVSNTQLPMALGVTNTIAKVAVPTTNAVPTVTGIWFPEGIPDRPYPDAVSAAVDWPRDGTTRWNLRSLPIPTLGLGDDHKSFDDFNWLAYLRLRYSGEGGTMLNMDWDASAEGIHAPRWGETVTWTGSSLNYFITGECTSTLQATVAQCTGSYGVTGYLYTSVQPGGTAVTVGPISSVIQFPTAPRITAAKVTVTSAPPGFFDVPSTASSSARGVPRATQHVAAILGAAVLGGAAAMAV